MVIYFLRKQYVFLVIGIILFMLLSACSSEDSFNNNENVQNDQVWKKASLKFVPVIEQNRLRVSRNTSYEPCDYDMLIIKFSNSDGTKVIKGYARYNSSNQSWELNYMGNLSHCSNQECEVIYVGNNPELGTSQDEVIFNSNSPVFICKNAVYDFTSNDEINLYATLSPNTSRIRFKGDKESAIDIKGFGSYIGFNITDWQFNEEDCLNPLNVKIDNSSSEYLSPYYYIFLGNEHLWVKDNEHVYIWKKNPSDFLNNGTSGLIYLPSINTDSWNSDTYRSKNVSEITISPDKYGGWTQTQEQTRFYSNVGIQVELTYMITSFEYDNFTSYPFVIGYWAYDNEGNFLDSRERGTHIDEIKLNKEINIKDEFYVEGASYYQIQFYELKLGAKITNFKISTF